MKPLRPPTAVNYIHNCLLLRSRESPTHMRYAPAGGCSRLGPGAAMAVRDNRSRSIDILSDDELRENLEEFGFSPGPVTHTTREVLVRKLRRLSLEVAKTGTRIAS